VGDEYAAEDAGAVQPEYGASGPADSAVSPATSRPPNIATPESTTRISGGTVMESPPKTDTARIVISCPGRIASRRSRSAPPKTVTTVLLGGTRQAPFLVAPLNTAMIRLARPRSPWPGCSAAEADCAAGRSSRIGTRSA
jgi:hypothetical protein